MKRFEIYLMDLLALILIIGSFLLPFIGDSLENLTINTNTILMLINCYLIAYLGFIISFMDTKKVILMSLPLLIYSIFLVFFMNGFKLNLGREILDNLAYIITNLFGLILLVFIFFLIDLTLNRLLGTRLAGILAILGLTLYLVMQNTEIIPFDFDYKDALAYFAFFVMGSRIRPANSINKSLFILAFILLAGEIYLNYYFSYYPSLNFSLFIISYLIFKSSYTVDIINKERYLVFAYIYPYKLNYILLKSIVKASPLVITIIAILSTFLIAEFLYKLRVKFIDYGLVGIH